MQNTNELSQSITLGNIIPQHIQENNPGFVEFLAAYYDWMEQVGNTNNILHKFGSLDGFVNYFAGRTDPSSSSYDIFAKELYELYSQEYAPSYPTKKIVREDIFIKSIREVLSNKGSVDSIKYFFKTIYDEDVEITFPVIRRLTYNQSQLYVIKTHFFVDTGSILSNYYKMVGTIITGEFFCSARVESVRHYTYGPYTIVEFQIQIITPGTFIAGETVSGKTVETTPTQVDFVVGGIISGYEIINPGSGYSTGQSILIYDEFQIEPAAAVVSSVSSTGQILSVSILNYGYGYQTDVIGQINSFYGDQAVIRFIASSSTRLDDTIYTNSLSYIESNKSVIGKDSLGNYVSPGYVNDGYVTSGQGSTNPLDYPLSKIKMNAVESTGKHYFEFHVYSASDLNFPANVRIGASRVTQNFWLDYELDWFEFPYNYAYGLQVFCIALDFKSNGTCDLYIGAVYDDGDGVKRIRWKDGSGHSLTPNTPAYANVPTGNGLTGSASFRITPFQKVKLATHPTDFLCDTVPVSFQPWDNAGSATAKVVDDSQLSVDESVRYTYKIRTSLSAPLWNKVYKAAIHPAGTKYTVDLYNVIDLTGETSPNLLTVKSQSNPKIKHQSFAIYDIQQRENLVLNSPTDLCGPVGLSGFSPDSGLATILDLPTNIFDMDIMTNSAAHVDVKIS